MRVEILGARLSSSDPATGRLYVQEVGDVLDVSDDVGSFWCAQGWARDVSGTVPTGERVVRHTVIQPRNAAHRHYPTEV